MTDHVISQKGKSLSQNYVLFYILPLKISCYFFRFFPIGSFSEFTCLIGSDCSVPLAPLTYDLIGVSNHFGNVGFGHYTAYTLNASDQCWYEFNDSSVTKISDTAKIVAQEAYLLLYRRRDIF